MNTLFRNPEYDMQVSIDRYGGFIRQEPKPEPSRCFGFTYAQSAYYTTCPCFTHVKRIISRVCNIGLSIRLHRPRRKIRSFLRLPMGEKKNVRETERGARDFAKDKFNAARDVTVRLKNDT